jgi:hypothetical protein
MVTKCTFNGNVTGNGWTGGVVGYNMGGSIDNCSSSGYVNGGDQYTGGLVGQNYGSLKYSFSTSSVDGTDRVGGAVGYNEAPAGVIEHCFSEGNVTGRDYLGGLVGNNEGGKVDHCEAHGFVEGGGFVGGFIGYNTGNVENSSSTGKVNGSGGGVGGFIGRNRFGDVIYCQSESNTNANGPYSGGFTGINELSTISNCFSKGHVVSTSDFVGGFTGRNQFGVITSCYSTGNAGGSGDPVGGFVGSNDESDIDNCYSTGNVSGDDGVGGFAGVNFDGSISHCYSSGQVQGNSHLGGFCGSSSGGSISSSFFDNNTSGVISSVGGTGKNTSEMMMKATFSSSGWDFNGVWEIISTYTYPYLQNHSYQGPEIVTDHDSTAIEDSWYEIDYEAVSDYPGNNMFQWTIVTSADWLSMSLDGTLSGTPENEDVGETTVKVICSLPTVGQISSVFTLTVENTNDAPLITSSPRGNAPEDLLYSTQFVASDIDPTGDTFTWSLETGPDWLSIDSDTGWLNGTPLNDDVGTHTVNVTVSDGNGGSDWIRFTITVENTNDNPVITTIPISTINEDSLFSTYFQADDIDPVSTSFMWSLDTDASWLSLTGNHLHGTPANSDVGSYWVNVSVNDGYGGLDWTNYTLTVINTNDDPIFTFTPITSATEDQLYSLRATAFDPDPTSDQLRYILKSGPEWLSMDTFTGWLNGTPENKDVGSHPINVSVNDGIGGHCYMEFIITVTNVNDDPEITTRTPPSTVLEDTEYSVHFSAVDIDPKQTDFEWSMETNATWLSLDENHLHGTPTNDDVGLFMVNITLMDGDGGSAWREFNIEVVNTNDDPYFTAGPPHFAPEDLEYNTTLEAEDPDPTNDTLTWNLDQGPDFLSIDPETGRLFGIPTNEDVGVWEVIVSVEDGNGGTGTLEFEIRVVNTNDDPIIITQPITDIEEDEEYFLRLVATDEDPGDNVLEWEMKTNATWLSLYGDLLKGTPGDDDVGSFFVNITVDDGNGGYDQLYFMINVSNTNDPPRIISDPVYFASEDELYTMQPNVIDADIGDSFQWTMTGPDWLNIDPDTGLVNGTPTNDDVGQHWIKIMVTDIADETDSISFMLNVQNTNDAPTWKMVPGDWNMTEEELLTDYASAEDPDGDTLTYTISSTPDLSISINPDTGMILCNMPPPGSYVVTVTASDGTETIEMSFNVNVSEVPEVIIPTEETDTDSDGMPDWWEDLYDLDPEDPSDAMEDLDDDGITNLEEFTGRTSPTEDNSEPEEKGTNPVFFIIIAILAILAIVFLALFLLKGSGKDKTEPEMDNIRESETEVPVENNAENQVEPEEQKEPENEQ